MTMTQKEMATLGGYARARKLSQRERIDAARKAGSAPKRKRSKGAKPAGDRLPMDTK